MMIADPIKVLGTNIVQEHFAKSSEPIFVVGDGLMLALTTGIGQAAWYILTYGSSGPEYHDDCVRVTREQFVDYMAQNYHDYLEWLLFHPEWL